MIKPKEETFSENQLELSQQKQCQLRKDRYLDASLNNLLKDQSLVSAPRQISKKSYSLEPDMVTGWRPRRKARINYQNVFPLAYNSIINDEIVKQLAKNKSKQSIVYLGPRKGNSYILHQNNSYDNPYPVDKRVDRIFSERPNINKYFKPKKSNLSFNSDFESGNLDMAIEISEKEFDLFMRVDTNTKGHTNWFYFEVKNQDWIGTVKFNICNFRRQKSLYQRGMKPYVKSEKQDEQWTQRGGNVTYERRKPRYKFLYDEDDEETTQILCTYFTMTFTYDFQLVNDTVKFAYCVPYTYSNLLTLVREISLHPMAKCETGWRSLSGLPVPLIQITDFQEPNHNKKVVLITARIHPGESNSSYVCEGFVKSLFQEQSKEILKKYHFFIIPMLNPDGVVAGNYRTSLFGKDLNRTFNQSRKYAFPETFHLITFAKTLKKQHKQRFTIYIDLHGHSVKKNAFFYGPDYSLAHTFYNQCRELPRILGNLTCMFRYYSCIFRISTEKTTTARATLNRQVSIPFTFTMESSNGSFYDSNQLLELNFNGEKWKEMGAFLVKGLGLWAERIQNTMIRFKRKTNFIVDSDEEQTKKQVHQLIVKEPPGKEKMSDDEISEGKSDSEPSEEDLDIAQLQALEREIQGVKKTPQVKQQPKEATGINSINKTERPYVKKIEEQKVDWSRQLRKSHNPNSPEKKNRLPPINMQANHASFLSHKSKKRKMLISEGLRNLSAMNIEPVEKPKRTKIDISQLLMDMKKQPLVIEQTKPVLKRKISRQEIIENARKFK